MNQIRIHFALVAGLIALLLPAAMLAAQPATKPPHVILIYTDDMGIGDLSCYGGKLVETKHIDRLAAEGMRFTQFYSASPICSPSRVAVTTGMFPARWRINSYLQTRAGNRACEQVDFLDPKAPTLARTLKSAGYVTAHFGKWHMGGGRDVNNAPSLKEYGFDEFASTWESPTPAPEIPNEPWKPQPSDKVKRHERTAFFVDKTLDFLKRHKDKPCYVNLWPDDMHDPYMPGADRLKEQDRDDVPVEQQKYRAALTEYDIQIGRLLDGLKELKLDENTIVIFTSDNGPHPSFDHARTGGLRGQKWSLYEGGIRVPMIVRFPGQAPAGRVDEKTVGCSIDLFPTICSLTGVKLPALSADQRLDGPDLSGALRGEPVMRTTPLYWEYGRNAGAYIFPSRRGAPGSDDSPNVAVREGQWKLLVHADGKGAELYDLSEDAAEKVNVADKHADVTARLREQALKWRQSLPVLQEKP